MWRCRADQSWCSWCWGGSVVFYPSDLCFNFAYSYATYLEPNWWKVNPQLSKAGKKIDLRPAFFLFFLSWGSRPKPRRFPCDVSLLMCLASKQQKANQQSGKHRVSKDSPHPNSNLTLPLQETCPKTPSPNSNLSRKCPIPASMKGKKEVEIKKKIKKETKEKNCSNQDSRVVPHRSTGWSIPCLTSQIGRDAVLSRFYGRR